MVTILEPFWKLGRAHDLSFHASLSITLVAAILQLDRNEKIYIRSEEMKAYVCYKS